MPNTPDVRLNVRIPAELHRRFKIAAAQSGTKMSDIVLAAVQSYVEGCEAWIKEQNQPRNPAK